jgi:hypothetical protein
LYKSEKQPIENFLNHDCELWFCSHLGLLFGAYLPAGRQVCDLIFGT